MDLEARGGDREHYLELFPNAAGRIFALPRRHTLGVALAYAGRSGALDAGDACTHAQRTKEYAQRT